MLKIDTAYSVSQYMTDLMCYMGQELVYESASEAMEKLIGTAVNAKQIERLCHHYGQKLEEVQEQSIEKGDCPVAYPTDQTHYVMIDGSMLLTREEKWKEIKLGRIFSEKNRVEVSKKRQYITGSTYIGHLGPHTDFLKKIEHHTETIKKKVIIADGAKWIWNWADDFNEDSIQILDFYHAKEHLCQFAQLQFQDSQQRKRWVDKQSLLLLNDRIKQVITTLKKMKAKSGKAEEAKTDLIKYYQNNKKRMMYRTFKEKGLLIGSGAIEAAHRHVIQQRMKLSGQRWTKQGAQQLSNIRMLQKSNQWNQLVDLITQKAA